MIVGCACFVVIWVSCLHSTATSTLNKFYYVTLRVFTYANNNTLKLFIFTCIVGKNYEN